MAIWKFTGFKNKLKKYKCSSCGFEKTIMHAAMGKRRPKNDGRPNRFLCPMCKEDIEYEKKE